MGAHDQAERTLETTRQPPGGTSQRGVFRHRAYARLWIARVAATVAAQIVVVSIGWQLYVLTGSAFDLGLVGLMQFLPLIPLTLLIGHVADRYDRARVIAGVEVVYAAAALVLLAGTLGGFLDRTLFLAVALVMGASRAFELPTMAALMPTLVPRSEIPSATAWWASANQTAQIVGPAIGGVLLAVSPALAYGTAMGLFASAAVLVALVRAPARSAAEGPRGPTGSTIFSGFVFLSGNRAVLGALSLDLVTVLLAGATALMPVIARDVLGTGPEGLGLLRAAPAAGALATAVLLARWPLRGSVGPILFAAVALFGLATIVFALSKSLWISMAALAVVGASDVVSVVIRMSLVQLQTPDDLRGRVNAVNALFVGTSNQLGEFRAGVIAAAFGVVPAVLLGGCAAVGVAALWMLLFPELRRMRRLEG